MKFEICETVETTDHEMVLRALELCSREVSSEVVREGDRIMVHGLGPSPRAKNVHDTTVFCVNAEDDKTVINGEVSFQASALLGDQPQGDVVRSKLDELFSQLKAQIDLVSRRGTLGTMAGASNSTAPPVMEAAKHSPVRNGVLVEERAVTVAEPMGPNVLNGMPKSGFVDVVGGGRSKLAAYLGSIAEPEHRVEVERTVGLGQGAELEQTSLPKQNGHRDDVWLTDLRQIIDSDLHARTVLDVDELPPTIDEEEVPAIVEDPPTTQAYTRTTAHTVELSTAPDEEETPARKRVAVWVTGLVLLVLVAAGSYSVYRSRTSSVVPPVSTIQQSGPTIQPSIPTVEPPAQTAEPAVPMIEQATPTGQQPAPPIQHPAAVATNPAPTTVLTDAKPLLPPTQSEVVNPAVQVAEVNVWLANWAAAMRTRDSNAQAAFYADTVDRYVGKNDVSRDAVRRDREATIRMRKGLWTMKMEKVVIERQTKSEAEVRLVKHFIRETAPSEIMESFVPTRLTLRRIDGSWRITSEEDLPGASAATQIK
jgi:ketosteroid isomerase-like protein